MTHTMVRTPHEWREQEAVMAWAVYHARLEPRLLLLYHIPNGEKRDGATAAKLEKMGVKPGIPDLHLPVASRGWHSLYIEMKRIGKHETEDQRAMARLLHHEGNYVYVAARGWSDAVHHLCWYLQREDLVTELEK